MKKVILAMMAFCAICVTAAQAASVTASLLSGKSLEGRLLSLSDTMLVMEPFYYSEKLVKLHPNEVHHFSIPGAGRYSVVDGKFVPDAKTQARIDKQREREAELASTNPNEVIADALKKTGAAALGFGIPSLFVGTILVAYGSTGLIALPKNVEEAEKNLTKSKYATAGYVLLPMGAALTIVGIPLYAHGKRLAEINLKYTGNGAGVAMEF